MYCIRPRRRWGIPGLRGTEHPVHFGATLAAEARGPKPLALRVNDRIDHLLVSSWPSKRFHSETIVEPYASEIGRLTNAPST